MTMFSDQYWSFRLAMDGPTRDVTDAALLSALAVARTFW